MSETLQLSAATGRSGRNHLHHRSIAEREQDPDWPTLNLIWLDILYPGIKSVRPSVQSFFSHQIANSPIRSSHRSRRLGQKDLLSVSFITNLRTPTITSPNKTNSTTKNYNLNSALHTAPHPTRGAASCHRQGPRFITKL